jgi:hypothetical protein
MAGFHTEHANPTFRQVVPENVTDTAAEGLHRAGLFFTPAQAAAFEVSPLAEYQAANALS